MALATLEHLRGIGALDARATPDSPAGARGTLLLQAVSDQVCSWLNTTEAALLAGLTAAAEGHLAIVVAEVAGRRLQNPAAGTSDPMAGDPAPWLTALLTQRDKDTLLGIQGVAAVIDPDTAGTVIAVGKRGAWTW